MRKVDVAVAAYRKAIVEGGCKYVVLEDFERNLRMC